MVKRGGDARVAAIKKWRKKRGPEIVETWMDGWLRGN